MPGEVPIIGPSPLTFPSSLSPSSVVCLQTHIIPCDPHNIHVCWHLNHILQKQTQKFSSQSHITSKGQREFLPCSESMLFCSILQVLPTKFQDRAFPQPVRPASKDRGCYSQNAFLVTIPEPLPKIRTTATTYKTDPYHSKDSEVKTQRILGKSE